MNAFSSDANYFILFEGNINVSNGLDKKDISGTVAGNFGSAENYADNVKMGGMRGHGFAAEKANHLYDRFSGKDAQIVGDDNAKNGADRLVDGVQIQTKFCSSGGKCVSECFDGDVFRYWNTDQTPMQIEVPKDFYHDAKQSFAHRVERSPEQFNISGTPEEIKEAAQKLADETIKESPFTYAQAKNIAKFGTIESLTFDAVNGIRVAGTAMGISAVISFATAVWSGKNFDEALKSACYSGLKVGGIAWVSSIATAQVGRTGIEQALRPVTDWVVKQMGSKTTAMIANSMRVGSKSIYGAAAANNLSKLLRGNIVTSVITIGVLSSADLYRMFQGRMSGAQVFKNITNTAAGVVGGTAGWMGGAATGATIGNFIVPGAGGVVGTVIGGVMGSFGGGAAASKTSSLVMDNLIEDDSKEMYEILQKTFTQLSEEYLLSKLEAENILDGLKGKLSLDLLRDMYASSSREEFAKKIIEPLVVKEVRSRKVILTSDLPTWEHLSDGLECILQEELEASKTTGENYVPNFVIVDNKPHIEIAPITSAGSFIKSFFGMEKFIEYDSKGMNDILQKTLTQLSEEYSLSTSEVQNVIDGLEGKLSLDKLRDMHASSSREEFAKEIIELLVLKEVRSRKVILTSDLPTLENLSDMEECILKEELEIAEGVGEDYVPNFVIVDNKTYIQIAPINPVDSFIKLFIK